jgi:hypothetical protein
MNMETERFDLEYPNELLEAETDLINQRRKAAEVALPSARVGVALSGGGIRSATFCLGVFQALAENKLLRKIDFLSTVSGGGYFGSFLGRLFTRNWICKPDLEGLDPAEPLDPPPGNPGWLSDAKDAVSRAEAVLARSYSWCMRYLRDNGRYLSPNGAGDTIMAVAIFLRNWISVLFVLMVLALSGFLFLSLLRALAWKIGGNYLLVEQYLLQATGKHLWWSPLLLIPPIMLLLLVIPSAWAYWQTQTTWSGIKSRGLGWMRWLHERVAQVAPVLVCGGSIATTFLMRGNATGRWISLAVAVQALLSMIFYWGFRLRMRLLRVTVEARDRYWIRNRLSNVLAVSLAATCIVFLLALVDSLGQSAYCLFHAEEGFIRPLQVLAVASGLAAIAAMATRIKFLLDRLPKGLPVRISLDGAAAIGAGILVLLLLTLVSVGAHFIAWGGNAPNIGITIRSEAVNANAEQVINPGENIVAQNRPTEQVQLSEQNYIQVVPVRDQTKVPEIVRAPSPAKLAAAFGISLLLSLLIGQTLAFINLSSLHAFYSARLTRAFLGATNPQRWKDPLEGQRISNPIRGDDIAWQQYRPWSSGGPLHIVNVTLNETVIGKTQIEYRDRKGLIMAVGPCGISVGAHDHALWEKTLGSEAAPDSSGRYVSIMPIRPEPNKFHALGLPSIDGSRLQKFGTPHLCEASSLGRWVGISGAAFTTGMGYRTSLGKSMLMGLFNVRLGYWWTSGINPWERGKARTREGRFKFIETLMTTIFPAQIHLISELTARFHGPVLNRWYLSDGGHFENTAAYELIRRRVPFIVLCDCGCDPNFEFEDIANLSRVIRTDFGAELSFLGDRELAALGVHERVRTLIGKPEEFAISGRGRSGENTEIGGKKHALLARVNYTGVDSRIQGAQACCSHILILKPSLAGDEPIDVLHYRSQKPDFPNESTADQYFDEAQWESYRALGHHIGRLVFHDYRSGDDTMEDAWQPRDFTSPGAKFAEERTAAQRKAL